MSIENMVFVITGAARGIGAETARMAAERGARVVLSDVNDVAGEETAAAIRKVGGAAHYVHCDVSAPDEVANLMETAHATFGGIDVLHNNAGVHEAMISDAFSFEDMSVETFDRVMAVNVRGAFLCTKAALPHLKRSTAGPSVINAGSTASWVGYPYGLAYGTSKGAISLFTKNLAVALAPYGIRSNCYCPASVDTDMVRIVSTSLGGEPAPGETPGAGAVATHLVRRIGSTADVAELVCFLASPQAGFVNGVTWLIDGGVLAWRDTVDSIGL